MLRNYPECPLWLRTKSGRMVKNAWIYHKTWLEIQDMIDRLNRYYAEFTLFKLLPDDGVQDRYVRVTSDYDDCLTYCFCGFDGPVFQSVSRRWPYEGLERLREFLMVRLAFEQIETYEDYCRDVSN